MQYTREMVLNDIEIFKTKGYHEKLQKMYRKFPKTTCKSCGTCCNDSPITTYPEVLFALNYFESEEKFTPELKIQIYKDALSEYFYGLVSTKRKCPFLDESNLCMIHEVAPISCKRWGLQSEKDNKKDWQTDLQGNKLFQEYYAKLGIHIPDEVVNCKTPYCNNVKITKNPYNFLGRDFNKVVTDMMNMVMSFRNKNAQNFSLGNYIVQILLGRDAVNERIKVVKDYQSGNEQAIEDYVNGIDYTKFI